MASCIPNPSDVWVRRIDLTNGKSDSETQKSISLLIFEDIQLGPGGRVWDAALALSRHLMEEFSVEGLRDKRVIEIGAGVGLCGIVAAKLGAQVVLTDKQALIPLIQRNADTNCNVWRGPLQSYQPKRKRKRNSRQVEYKESHNLKVNEIASTENDRNQRHSSSTCGFVRSAILEWGSKGKKLRPPFDLILASDVVGCGDESLFIPLLNTLEALVGENGEVLMSYKYRADFEDEFFVLASDHFRIEDVSSFQPKDLTILCSGNVHMDSYQGNIRILRMKKIL